MRFLNPQIWTLGLALHVLLSGCVTPLVCTESGAFQSGQDQALKGMGPDTGVGSICKGKYARNFLSNYDQGYQEGYRTLCSKDTARKEGKKAGQSGLQQDSLPVRFKLCQNELPSLNRVYAESYQLGLSEYCSPEAATVEGLQNGRDGSTNQLNVESWKVCGPQGQSANQKAYQKAYERGLHEFCEAPGLEEAAYNQGYAYRKQPDVRSHYSNCAETKREQLETSYKQAYERGLRAYCLPERHREMMQYWIPSREQPTFTVESYQACIDTFADIWSQYKEIYRKERADYVQMHCTFAAGRQAGRIAAPDWIDYELQTPAFCNAATLASYQQGFDVGWREVKEQICSPHTLQELGYQHGQQGLHADAPIPNVCPSSMRLSMETSYRIGYERGLRLFTLQQESAHPEPPPPPQKSKPWNCRLIAPVPGPLRSQILLTGPQGEVFYPDRRTFMRRAADGSFFMYYPDGRNMLLVNSSGNQVHVYWPNGTQLRYPQNMPLGRTLFLSDSRPWYFEVEDPANQRLNADPQQTFAFHQSSVTYRWDPNRRDLFRGDLTLPEGLLRFKFEIAANRLVLEECVP